MAILLGLIALATSAVVVEQPASPSRDDNPERLICRSSQETGSFVRRRRQCFTRAQWQRVNDAAREGARYLQENGTTRPCGSGSCPYSPQ